MSLPVAAAQRRSLGTAAPHRSSHLDSMKSLRAGAFAAPSRHAMRLRTYTRAVQVSATLQRAVEAEADPAAVDRVLAAFPKDQCSADEARVLYSAGYDFLDTRSDLELESEGRVAPRLPGSLAVPLVRFAKLYDSAKGRKVVKKTLNDDFVASVGALAPSKAQGLILVCSGVPSQGQLRCRQALQLLREAGYTRLSMLDGGYAVRCLRGSGWAVAAEHLARCAD